jgi:hypothetical protein
MALGHCPKAHRRCEGGCQGCDTPVLVGASSSSRWAGHRGSRIKIATWRSLLQRGGGAILGVREVRLARSAYLAQTSQSPVARQSSLVREGPGSNISFQIGRSLSPTVITDISEIKKSRETPAADGSPPRARTDQVGCAVRTRTTRCTRANYAPGPPPPHRQQGKRSLESVRAAHPTGPGKDR